jgi:hypothetical protein
MLSVLTDLYPYNDQMPFLLQLDTEIVFQHCEVIPQKIQILCKKTDEFCTELG